MFLFVNYLLTKALICIHTIPNMENNRTRPL
jgi:hypothetical protein